MRNVRLDILAVSLLKMTSLHQLLLASLALLGLSSAHNIDPEEVLFIGSSCIFYNDLPDIVHNLAAGVNKTLYADSRAEPSWTWEMVIY